MAATSATAVSIRLFMRRLWSNGNKDSCDEFRINTMTLGDQIHNLNAKITELRCINQEQRKKAWYDKIHMHNILEELHQELRFESNVDVPQGIMSNIIKQHSSSFMKAAVAELKATYQADGHQDTRGWG